MRWTVVIPAKALPAAKSRLATATPDPDTHRALVEAIRADTTAAARAAEHVARILVVADRAAAALPGLELLVQHSPGLNAALAEAAVVAADRWPDDGVAALVGDLPALRPDELSQALELAAQHRRAFVPDSAGTGTTLLTVTPGTKLAPEFGPGSASRHAAGAVALEGGLGLRHDVDTPGDLLDAVQLGLGPATAGVMSRSVTTRSS